MNSTGFILICVGVFWLAAVFLILAVARFRRRSFDEDFDEKRKGKKPPGWR